MISPILTITIPDAVIWCAAIILASLVLMCPVSYIVASYCVYHQTLDRKKNNWTRDVPMYTDEKSLEMDRLGQQWAAQMAQYKHDVHTVSGGLNLYGEYYDFGNKRCVMILSGRTESLRYGYYFARPYSDAGYNVLVVDPRAHGHSEGEFNTVGFEESRDAICWAKQIREQFGVESVLFHGICIGAAAGMLAICSEDCPEYVCGIVTEGMFANFAESMKNHLIERKKPVFVMLDLIDRHMIRNTSHSMKRGPIDVIYKLRRPLLMLHSREDIYSTPEYAEKLFELAGCEQKRIVWFDHGAHSMLRITDTTLYDSSIRAFLDEVLDAPSEN